VIVYIVFAPVIFLVSCFTSAHYAKINKKKTSGYIKRMWEQIGLLFAASLGINLIGGPMIMLVFGRMLDKINHPYVKVAVVKIALLVTFLVLSYKIISKYGFKDSMGKQFNLHFEIETLIYSFIVIAPSAIFESVIFAHNNINMHTLFTPVRPLYNDKVLEILNGDFRIAPVIAGLIVTFAIEVFVLTLAYKNGKKAFIKKHVRGSDVFQTDEKAV